MSNTIKTELSDNKITPLKLDNPLSPSCIEKLQKSVDAIALVQFLLDHVCEGEAGEQASQGAWDTLDSVRNTIENVVRELRGP